MGGSFWLSPAFLVSAAVTLAATCYSYIYLPYQMRKAYRQSLLTLARAVETKDKWSQGHGERVARYVLAVAGEMHVPPGERWRIEYATFLQNIGDVGVPHTILNKKGPLTPKESDLLKNHTTIGAEMVEQVKFLRDISVIIRHHHEAWDGSGYPDRLKGEDIPLGARIVALCTDFDSMIRAVPYRSQMNVDRALEAIHASVGTKYDPAVVSAFFRAYRKHWQSERWAP